MSDQILRRDVKLTKVGPAGRPTRQHQAIVKLYTQDGLLANAPKSYVKYAFVELYDEMADVVRGELPEGDGYVMHIGSHFGKNYYESKSRTVPVDVLEKMHDRGLTLVRGIEGGWRSWEGRPEWSDTFIDFRDAEVVDMAVEIEERRADQ